MRYQKSIERMLATGYPNLMRKLICILLMSWLPVFMVTANAMSLQMMTKAMHGDMQAQADMPCHDRTDHQPAKTHNCISCGFCMAATSMANFDSAPVLDLPVITSPAPVAIDVIFESTNDSPAFRPPILS
jgi:hypothetical protein